MQPRHQATFTQPFQCELQRLSCKTQKNYAQRPRKLQLQNRISTPKRKKKILKHFVKGILKGNLPAPKLRKSWQINLAAWSNTIYDFQLKKPRVLRMQPRHEATLTQPFQCDLPPELQETHRTTHTGTTTRCKTHRRNNSRQKRPQPQPPIYWCRIRNLCRKLELEGFRGNNLSIFLKCFSFHPPKEGHKGFSWQLVPLQRMLGGK